uniref:ATP synthase complex subunit 8 n=1 Tax=Curculionidae sp. BMNH 1042554 TaxID=2834647 RepID=A0A8F5A5N5_9CUCU|nr:ATP synthase F0 subunit 8 [Curculionidae sp. BMNH 1042554]
MPQMAPINWLSLYFLFTMMFLIFIIMNYFSFLYKPKMTQKKKKFSNSWKW